MSSPTKRFAYLLAACSGWLVIRSVYNSIRQLVPDEAYYWVWSHHLAGGYLDHPPMIAWIIHAGTVCLGESEFAVRSGAAILAMGTILVLLGLLHRLHAPAIPLAAAILLLGPMMAVLGTIITPDTPVCFFTFCALAAAIVAVQTTRHALLAWLVFGVAMGLALLSKYTAILLIPAVGLALLSTREGRRQLSTPWPWLALMLAGLIFWPTIDWNRRHDWASFRFQWHHGAGNEPTSPLVNLLSYAGAQAAIYTPVLFVLGLLGLVHYWRRLRSLDTTDRMLLFSATFPLLFFAVFALRHRPEPNWPVFAYLPLTILLARWGTAGRVGDWPRIGLIVAAAMMVVGQTPELLNLVPTRLLPTIPNPWEEMFGWRDYGRMLDDRAAGAQVYCTSYENAAEASFYMAGHPMVWTLEAGRPTALDFFAGRPDPASLGRVVCVTRASTVPDVPAGLRSFTNISVQPWQTTALGRVVRRRQIVIAAGHAEVEKPSSTQP